MIYVREDASLGHDKLLLVEKLSFQTILCDYCRFSGFARLPCGPLLRLACGPFWSTKLIKFKVSSKIKIQFFSLSSHISELSSHVAVTLAQI